MTRTGHYIWLWSTSKRKTMKKLTDFLTKNWSGIILMMIVSLFIFYTIGYFAGAIWGKTFNLESVWVGVAALTTAAVTGLAKFFIDSKYNTPPGEAPKKED